MTSGVTPDISLAIKQDTDKTSNNVTEKILIEIKRDQDELYDKLIDNYNKLKDSYTKSYKQERQLISESSTIKQAFEHSKDLLKIIVSYLDKTSELKEQLLLETIVGPWNGTGDITVKEKENDLSVIMDRNFKISFETNQAGQISKGVLHGKQAISTIKNNKKSIEDKSILGSVTGNIVPHANSFVVIKFEIPDKGFEKYNQITLTSKNIVLMDPIVTNKTIDEIFSLTTTNMKIYYNLILKTRKNINQTMIDKYNLFFNDLLYLLTLTSQDLISKEVYKALQIYPESEYVNNAFEDYFISRNMYYSEYLYSIPLSKQKLEVYHAYLGELMDLAALKDVGLVSKSTFKKIDLDLNNKDNIIIRTYYAYSNMAKKYFELKISKASFSEKAILEEEYKLIQEELNEVAESGLIH